MNDQPNEPTVAVSLTVKNVADALDFYTKAFNANELFRMPDPNGDIVHAEFMIGDTKIFISNEAPEWYAVAMPEGAMSSSLLGLCTDNCDKAYKQATEAGAESLKGPADNFWGFRNAILKDPYGYRWSLREIIEEVNPEEMQIRAEKFFREQS